MSLLGDSLSPFVQTAAHSQVCPQHNVYQEYQLYPKYQLQQAYQALPQKYAKSIVYNKWIGKKSAVVDTNFIIFMLGFQIHHNCWFPF